jgi:hypothetical protein
MPGPMKIPSLRERTEELQQKAAAQKEVKDEAIKAARKRIEAEEKQNTFDNFLATEESETRTPTKRGRGRPKKDKLAFGAGDEDPNITGLRALIKALKPFRGSKKEGLNGINLTYMIARDGTDKPSPIIYATNKHVGAFAYANFDLDLATLSTETVTGSISPDLAAELLIPPPAEMLVPVQFDTARSRLVKGDKGWEVELRDGPIIFDGFFKSSKTASMPKSR